MKLHIIIISLLLFSSCKAQDSETEIENIVSMLKNNRTLREIESIDKSLKILHVYSVREKMNNPELYDMKLSIEEIYLKTIKNKSYSDILKLSNDFIKVKKERVQYLEKEIKKRRLLNQDKTDFELVEINNLKITKDENYEYGKPFISIEFNNSNNQKVNNQYLYHIELYNLINQEILQTIGFGNIIESGTLNTNENSFIIDKLISENIVAQINNFNNVQYPINDIQLYNLGIRSYASLLTDEYINNGKPLEEDDFKSQKTIEELKMDLMKLKLLIVNIEN